MKRLLIFIFILSIPTWGASMKEMSHIEKIQYVFNSLSKDNLGVVDEFYHPDVEFIDPIGKHHGVQSVKKYYEGLYHNVKSVKFDFIKMVEEKQTVVAIWRMTLITDSLNGGEPIVVDGNSVITFHENGQVIFHRDYFDMGEFIYEKIPGLGFVVRKIKEKMKNN